MYIRPIWATHNDRRRSQQKTLALELTCEQKRM